MSGKMQISPSDLAKISGKGHRTSGHGAALLVSLLAGLVLIFVAFVFVLVGRRRREANAVFRVHNPNTKTSPEQSSGQGKARLPWSHRRNGKTPSPPRPALNFTRDIVVETQGADGSSIISHPRDSMLVGGGGSMFSTASKTAPRNHDLGVRTTDATGGSLGGGHQRHSSRSHGAVWTTEYQPSPTYSDFFEFEDSYGGPNDIRMNVQSFPESTPPSARFSYPEPLPSSHGSASFHIDHQDASRPPVPSLPQSHDSTRNDRNSDPRSSTKRVRKPQRAPALATQQLSDAISHLNESPVEESLSPDAQGDFTTYHELYPPRV